MPINLELGHVTYFGQCNARKHDASRTFLYAPVIQLGSRIVAFRRNMPQGAADPRRIRRQVEHDSNPIHSLEPHAADAIQFQQSNT